MEHVFKRMTSKCLAAPYQNTLPEIKMLALDMKVRCKCLKSGKTYLKVQNKRNIFLAKHKIVFSHMYSNHVPENFHIHMEVS